MSLNILVNVCRNATESFRDFEVGFNAFASKFKSHGFSINFPESIKTFMLMASAVIENNHRDSILAATSKDLLVASDVKILSR